MVDKYLEGKDVVYGVRKQRETDTVFKRISAEAYYQVLKWMGVNVMFNHADYRLMSRRSLDALNEYNEVNLFLRGIIPSINFPSAVVSYKRQKRFAGESKYPLHKMFALAIDGITSFSPFPLRLIAGLGVLVFVAQYCSPFGFYGYGSSPEKQFLAKLFQCSRCISCEEYSCSV